MLRLTTVVVNSVLLLFMLLPGSPLPLAKAGGGTFINSGQVLGGETGNGVALGDLDGDGDTDAFVANDYIDLVFEEGNQVWFNQGDGSFSAGPLLGTSDGYAVDLGDLDGDGDLDALVVGYADLSTAPAQVWLNQDGDQGGDEGEFAAGDAFGSFSSYGVALADVDSDGDLDAMVVGNSNQLWLNNGNALFTAGPALPFLYSEDVALADLDDDGWLDVVIADSSDGSNNGVWWNDGNWDPGPGSFTQGDALPTGSLMDGLAVGDLDDDGREDLFLAGFGQDQIYWNEGSRNLTAIGPLSANDSSSDVALADVDGDGLLDAIVANGSADPNRLWHNEGNRTFTVTQEFGDEAGLYWARELGLADLNGDGSTDLFEVTTADDRVWFNTGGSPVVLNEEGWQIQTVDERGNRGFEASMALDANGYPHIAYVSVVADGYDDDFGEYSYNYTIHYAHWDGVRWQSEVVRSFLEDIDSVSLALDGSGYPHIAYVLPLDDHPQYVRWDGSGWQEVTVPASSDTYINEVSLALDASGAPHLTYTTQDWELKYSFWDSAAWQTETVDVGFIYAPNSLALDASGSPHVAYISCASALAECGPDPAVLKYARKSGGAWESEIVDVKVDRFNSLVLDDEGRPHVAYHTFGPYPPSLKHAYRDDDDWQYQVVGDVGTAVRVSLDLDAAGNAHLFYITADFDGTFFNYAHWDGAEWQMETLDYSSNTNYDEVSDATLALDDDDNVHASYYEPQFGDLRYVTWTLNWQSRTIPENGTIATPSIAVANGVPHIGYYKQSSGQVKLASWDGSWGPTSLDFVASPVGDLSVAAGNQFEHISYYDADNQRLMYGYWNGTAWNVEVVDEAGDVGRYNDLVLLGNSDGAPRIAYWDATSRRIKLAAPSPNPLIWNIYPNNAGPPLNADSGPLSATVLPGADIGVAYYDAGSGDLRLAVWDAKTASWTDELVAGATADVGRLNSLQTDGTDGAPVVVYLEQGDIRLAYKLGGLWSTEDVPPNTTGDSVTGLSLELGLNSRQRARVVYTTASGALYVANLADGVWQTEVVESGGVAPGEISSASDNRLHLAYARATNGLRYVFRTANLDVDLSVPTEPPPAYFSDGQYNPLDACQAILDFVAGDPFPEHGRPAGALLATPPTRLPSTILNQDEPMADLALFGAMTTLFGTTADGQYYTNLYGQHGSEMGQIGLEEPQLLWDAYGTLQNFIPGMEALVTGRGDEVVVTQAMVDDALDIWQRLAAAGSPQLASTINGELARYNDLQDFVGMSFDEWAEAIGVEPPPDVIHVPVIRR